MENQSYNNNNTNEINISSLVEKARSLNNTEQQLSEYYANIAILGAENNDVQKIIAYGIKSFHNSKNKNTIILIETANKILKRIKSACELPEGSALTIVRILYRTAKLLHETNDDFLSSYYYHHIIKLIKKFDGQYDSETKNQIDSDFNASLNKISEILNSEKMRMNNNPKLEEFKIYFSKNHGLEADDSYFLVSSVWFNNFIHFINGTPYSEKVYNRNNVCFLYFNDGSNKEDQKKYIGHFPGPINNFFITKIRSFWCDPDTNESYTNIYLKSNTRENIDYKFLNKKMFYELNNYFGTNYVIERKLNPQDNLIEVNLKRMKLLVLSSLFDNHPEYLTPRNIQISKYKTVGELKAKILRCVISLLNKKIDQNYSVRVYIPDIVENKKKELFKIIFSYKNSFKSYNVKGREIIDDHLDIEVKLNIT